jgi:hypothetical protein
MEDESIDIEKIRYSQKAQFSRLVDHSVKNSFKKPEISLQDVIISIRSIENESVVTDILSDLVLVLSGEKNSSDSSLKKIILNRIKPKTLNKYAFVAISVAYNNIIKNRAPKKVYIPKSSEDTPSSDLVAIKKMLQNMG